MINKKLISKKDKIKWFNDTLEWFEKEFEDYSKHTDALESVEDCADMPYDLFFDFYNQFKLTSNKK